MSSGKMLDPMVPPNPASIMAKALRLTNHLGARVPAASPRAPWPEKRAKKKPINRMAGLKTKLFMKQASPRRTAAIRADRLAPALSINLPTRNIREPEMIVANEYRDEISVRLQPNSAMICSIKRVNENVCPGPVKKMDMPAMPTITQP